MDIEKTVDMFIQTKENKYFTQIFNELEKPLYYFIRRTIKDNDTAHEILSNTFERIFIALRDNKYQKMKGVKFSSWAHSCALNAIRYYLRYYNKTYQQDTLLLREDEYLDDNQIEETHIKNVKIHREIVYFINNKLTEKNDLRCIAQMFYLDGEKLKDIAEELGYNVNNVKYRIRKIKDNIIKNVKIDDVDI